jgi:hypothetical protein
VAAWGANWNGQCSLPATLTNAMAVAAGDSHTVVLWVGTAPAPRMLNPVRNGDRFTVIAQTLNRRNYALEFKDALTATNWTALPATSGNGALRVLADPDAAAPQRFYRVRLGP